MSDVEIVLFDTHGESIGRGAHPGSLADRLKYLSPTASRQALSRANLPVREESSFQGGDGYQLFATRALALATVARIAEHAFHPAAGPIEDPIYAEPDFAADFFATVRSGMEALVEDPGYTALLGAFGPALIDSTGSRPAARQSVGAAQAVSIRHPRELRAIPNNAILQQLGWCANTLQGIGSAAARHPELFAQMSVESRRFRRALDLPRHALAHSDLEVLRALVGTLDPGSWLDRAARTRRAGRRQALVAVARALERLDLWAQVQAMFRRVQADHLALRAAWPDAPRMKPREVLLHALRLAVIQRVWLLATEIPEFSPRHGVTRHGLESALLRLEVPAALELLAEIFPRAPTRSPSRTMASRPPPEPLAPTCASRPKSSRQSKPCSPSCVKSRPPSRTRSGRSADGRCAGTQSGDRYFRSYIAPPSDACYSGLANLPELRGASPSSARATAAGCREGHQCKPATGPFCSKASTI